MVKGGKIFNSRYYNHFLLRLLHVNLKEVACFSIFVELLLRIYSMSAGSRGTMATNLHIFKYDSLPKSTDTEKTTKLKEPVNI